MIKKIPSKIVNLIFENKNWLSFGLVCSFCKIMFYHEPFVYTWLDGKQSLACSEKCHESIKKEAKY